MNLSAHKLNKKYFDVLFTFDGIRVLLVKSIFSEKWSVQWELRNEFIRPCVVVFSLFWDGGFKSDNSVLYE